MTNYIKYEVEDGIATLTLNRPEKRNAMNNEMLAEFGKAGMAASKDPSVRVLVITGSGGSFCAGLDLKEFTKQENYDRIAEADKKAKEDPKPAQKQSRWWPLVDCPKPVIGLIDGPAVGMGAEFSCHFDVRIATPRARFAWPFAQRGLVPDTGAGTWLLPRIIGASRAIHLIYSGQYLSAEEALSFGYVSEIVEPDQILLRGREMAEQYLLSSPHALARIKELFYEGFTADIAEHRRKSGAYLNEGFASEDHREGVMAHMEGRKPKFTAR
jgi:enoyl-CoA hydratase